MLTAHELSAYRWVASWVERPPALEAADAGRLSSLLADDERAQCEGLRPASVRDAFLLGRALLRRLLSAVTGLPPAEITLAFGPHGKPRLAETVSAARVEFNLAHCPTHIVVALSAYSSVGVDVETVRDYAPRLPERFFRPEEVDLLERLPENARRDAFFHLWVVKEACVKVLGGTLAPGLRAFPASLERAGRHGSIAWEALSVPPAAKAAVAFSAPDGDGLPRSGRLIRIDPSDVVSAV